MPSPAHAETWGWHLSLLSSPTPTTSAASSVKDSGGFTCPPSFLQFQPAHICSPTASVLPEKLSTLPCPCFNILSTLFYLCSHPPTFLVCPALFMSPVFLQPWCSVFLLTHPLSSLTHGGVQRGSSLRTSPTLAQPYARSSFRSTLHPPYRTPWWLPRCPEPGWPQAALWPLLVSPAASRPSRLMQMVAPGKNFLDEETTSPVVRGLQSAALVKRRTQGQCRKSHTTSLHAELVPAPPWLVNFRTSAQGVKIIVSTLGPLPPALAFVSFHSEWNGLASFY